MKLRAWHITGSALLTAMLTLLGCGTFNHVTRSAHPEDPPEADRYNVNCVIDVTDRVSNAEGFQVAGVGLVTGLNGTGSIPRPSGWRSRLEKELQRRKIPNVKALLDDK